MKKRIYMPVWLFVVILACMAILGTQVPKMVHTAEDSFWKAAYCGKYYQDYKNFSAEK